MMNTFTPLFIPSSPCALLPVFFPLSGLILHKAIALVYLFPGGGPSGFVLPGPLSALTDEERE